MNDAVLRAMKPVATVQPTEYIFHKGSFIRWRDATTHFLTHSLHYGGAAFEGIRSYETDAGAAIFRLRDHIERLFYSAKALCLEIPYTVDQLCDITVELVRMNNCRDSYIRPLAYYDEGGMGLNPAHNLPVVSIACWPRGAYTLQNSVDVKVSSVMRIHPDTTVVDAKLSAHYLNSTLATLELRGTHYHDALLLDYKGNIAEGPGANFFIVKGNTLVTPPFGNIVRGITRETIIEIAATLGLTTEERDITVAEAQEADEAFFTGTAAEVIPIRSLDDKVMKRWKLGHITSVLRELYRRAVRGKIPEFERYLTHVGDGDERSKAANHS